MCRPDCTGILQQNTNQGFMQYGCEDIEYLFVVTILWVSQGYGKIF